MNQFLKLYKNENESISQTLLKWKWIELCFIEPLLSIPQNFEKDSSGSF